jgi:hypothetical protein
MIGQQMMPLMGMGSVYPMGTFPQNQMVSQQRMPLMGMGPPMGPPMGMMNMQPQQNMGEANPKVKLQQFIRGKDKILKM